MPTPGPTNPRFDDVEGNRLVERNRFYHSLSPRARDAFLAELERAEADGVDEETAWRRAVVAAETAYGENP